MICLLTCVCTPSHASAHAILLRKAYANVITAWLSIVEQDTAQGHHGV